MNCHGAVPTQTVVTARGPGSNSVPQLLLFTGIVWLLRKAYFLLPNFSDELHAAPCKILKGNLPIFISAQLVHDLSHRLFHIQLATDHRQVISTEGIEQKKGLLGETFKLEKIVNEKKEYFLNTSTRRKPISTFLIASGKVLSVQKDLFHLGYSRKHSIIIWNNEATLNPLFSFFLPCPCPFLLFFLLKLTKHL